MNTKKEHTRILRSLIKEISTINPNQKPSIIVKTLDKMVYSCYSEIYKIAEQQRKIVPAKDGKHGHCR